MRILLLAALSLSTLFAQSKYDYRVLATTKTSTLEKEMNEAAATGFSFAEAMGGQSAFGGKEGVVVMLRDTSEKEAPKVAYRLLATNKTSTMQKEMQQLGDEGFDYKAQTVFNSAFGGQEVVVILERTVGKESKAIHYKLLATSKTSTMQKELKEAGDEGFRVVGMTVAKSAFGGNEVIAILRKD